MNKKSKHNSNFMSRGSALHYSISFSAASTVSPTACCDFPESSYEPRVYPHAASKGELLSLSVFLLSAASDSYACYY